jgi:hypothetical protein
MKGLGIAFGLILVLALPAAATVLEVPIPELTGTASCSMPPDSGSYCYRTLVIHLPTLPAAIRSVSLRIRGTTRFSLYRCETQPAALLGTVISAELDEPGNTRDLWYVWHANEAEGRIDLTLPFEPGYRMNGTWTFLLDGTATLNFYISGGSAIPECGLVGPPDSTTIESVTLLVDGDFPTGVARTSWGRLKAIYR